MLNPKIHYKIIYSINKLLDPTRGYFEIKGIYKENKKPVSEQGKEFYRLLTIYNKLLSNQLSIDLINEIETLTNTKINDPELLINTYNKSKESNNSISLMRYLLINDSFNDYTFELTSFLVNKLLIENDDIPIIFSRYSLEAILNQIRLGSNDYILNEILSELRIRTSFYLTRYDDGLNKDKIFDIVLSNKDYLNNQGINAVWLFGSFSNGTETPYSDIDLVISLFDKTKTKQDIKNIFYSLLGRLIDIHFIDDIFVGDSDISEDVKVLIFDER